MSDIMIYNRDKHAERKQLIRVSFASVILSKRLAHGSQTVLSRMHSNLSPVGR